MKNASPDPFTEFEFHCRRQPNKLFSLKRFKLILSAGKKNDPVVRRGRIAGLQAAFHLGTGCTSRLPRHPLSPPISQHNALFLQILLTYKRFTPMYMEIAATVAAGNAGFRHRPPGAAGHRPRTERLPCCRRS